MDMQLLYKPEVDLLSVQSVPWAQTGNSSSSSSSSSFSTLWNFQKYGNFKEVKISTLVEFPTPWKFHWISSQFPLQWTMWGRWEGSSPLIFLTFSTAVENVRNVKEVAGQLKKCLSNITRPNSCWPWLSIVILGQFHNSCDVWYDDC